MTGRSRKYLSDILIAVGLIEEFIADTSDFTDYQNDNKTRSAVERQLVIIGKQSTIFEKRVVQTLIHLIRLLISATGLCTLMML